MECLLNSNDMMGHVMNGRIGRGLCFLDLEILWSWVMHDHASYIYGRDLISAWTCSLLSRLVC